MYDAENIANRSGCTSDDIYGAHAVLVQSCLELCNEAKNILHLYLPFKTIFLSKYSLPHGNLESLDEEVDGLQCSGVIMQINSSPWITQTLLIGNEIGKA